MRSWLKCLVATIPCAVILGLSVIADATTAVFLSREELVRASDLVVRVKVGKLTYGESDDKRTLITRSLLDVTQFLKGTGPKQIVTQQFGGTYKGKTQKVLGDGQLVTGEDAIVFLKRGDKGLFYLTVLSQSIYHVDEKGMARRNLEGLVLVQRSGETTKPIQVVERAETVESIMTDIKRLASAH